MALGCLLYISLLLSLAVHRICMTRRFWFSSRRNLSVQNAQNNLYQSAWCLASMEVKMLSIQSYVAILLD